MQGYEPGTQLYDLSSAYGSRQQLRKLMQALKAAGIRSMADVVLPAK